jgi:hypothetical protein
MFPPLGALLFPAAEKKEPDEGPAVVPPFPPGQLSSPPKDEVLPGLPDTPDPAVPPAPTMMFTPENPEVIND